MSKIFFWFSKTIDKQIEFNNRMQNKQNQTKNELYNND